MLWAIALSSSISSTRIVSPLFRRRNGSHPLAAEPKSVRPQVATEWLTNSDSDLQVAFPFTPAINGIILNQFRIFAVNGFNIHTKKLTQVIQVTQFSAIANLLNVIYRALSPNAYD
jgi:hypothetical protein